VTPTSSRIPFVGHFLTMAEATIRAFCAQQRELLDLELKSEQEEKAAVLGEEGSRSHVLHHLTAANISVGLYGRTVVRLEAFQQTHLLPAHRFTTGDEVEIRSKIDRKDNPGGVVNEVTDESISIALFPARKGKSQRANKEFKGGDDEEENLLGVPPYSLLPKSSIEIHKKYMIALDELEKRGTEHPIAAHVVRALFDPSSHTDTSADSSTATFTPYNNSLDGSQLSAISFALSSKRPVALIHGVRV
jgi:hypothetical protein